MADYYSGFLAAVNICASQEYTFMVIDCPSGRGKSLAGIALRLLDPSCNKGEVATKFDSKLKVAHIVWDKAVDSQTIYGPLHAQQESEGVHVDSFYPRARELERNTTGMPSNKKSVAYQTYVWENLLQFLFVRNVEEPFVLDAFKSKHGLDQRTLILFLDEVPTNPVDVEFVGWVRDLIRFVSGVLVILAGTNSKAANMLGLVSGEASANDYNRENQRWSFLVTRLPAYDVNLSSFRQQWERCKSAAQNNPVIADVVRVIENSMKYCGNPRLINFAIEALAKVLPLKSQSFLEWHMEFVGYVLANKFFITRWSDFYYILIGQSNLLLAAAVFHATADILLHKHLANRAVPDDKVLATKPGCGAKDCGGWLRIANNRARGVGLQMFFEMPTDENEAYYGWQITVFAKAASDPLLHLGCCFPGGYFATPGSLPGSASYRAYHVAQLLWSHNGIGKLNFQNLQAITNSGSFLEVATSLAIINAAAVSKDLFLDLSQFLINFLHQMCIDIDRNGSLLQSEPAFMGCRVPKFIFPATDRSVPDMPEDLFGMLHRTANGEELDTFINYHFGVNSLKVPVNEIHFECKYWQKPGLLTHIIGIARKLIRNEGDIGVSVHRKCNEFWGGYQSSNFGKLGVALQNSEVGKMIFINEKGEFSTLVISSKPGTLVVVEVGAGWRLQQPVSQNFKFD